MATIPAAARMCLKSPDRITSLPQMHLTTALPHLWDVHNEPAMTRVDGTVTRVGLGQKRRIRQISARTAEAIGDFHAINLSG
ncbi:hypothetical protein [Blastomonas sp.]|uniref:hypothetical protein n=1 Tax=Blastomonas sp. TaxID=1909299 RepID=UPI00391C823D